MVPPTDQSVTPAGGPVITYGIRCLFATLDLDVRDLTFNNQGALHRSRPDHCPAVIATAVVDDGLNQALAHSQSLPARMYPK